MSLNDALAFGACLLACFAAASSGAFFKPGAWYELLDHPSWRPPNWLFPPAWAVLFLMIATSGWLVWRAVGIGLPLVVWAASLFVNAGWSWLFFGLRRPDWAFGNLSMLWLSIVANIAVFAPVSTTAAWLLVPYLAWVSFAGALNWAILRRNPRGYPGRQARAAPTPA